MINNWIIKVSNYDYEPSFFDICIGSFIVFSLFHLVVSAVKFIF